MAKKVVTRRELLDRWRGIEEEDDDSDPLVHRRLQQLKEEWFSDAFNFLIYLPKETHIWCGSWDLMGPLLETFYNFSKDERHDSPLKLLWKRISEEMRKCTQCICQHHQAKQMYNEEYEWSSIGPLLEVLQSLDEERITQDLKEMNARIARGEYDPVHDNAVVVSVMFEVLMFPVLLDDQSLLTEFQIFIEAIDNSHELTLAGHQQYPGVYALLFLKSRRARSISLRLAGNMGKLRTATDLEPLQPLLKKCIGFLETEALPSTSGTSRPRVQLDRVTVWLGIKALLGFLEPPAFEEGILERYPIFLSIVLNHISDDTHEFSFAVNCLRLLFEMLGCKLWLRATLSPSVMRNTLLGQCFHTQNEKSHKDIFDLFQPFLQSLEALQDGEHEKQRRHFIYFLLHQVTVSRNFSVLMRKKACQIALLIIHRGYKMNPPCPPFECAHMWGPSLVSSLKDSSLHISLRQPAFDLIQTIIVSDATALVTSMLNCQAAPSTGGNALQNFNDEGDDGLLFARDMEEKDISCWNEFSAQSKITFQEYGEWMCIPMLWFDVLVEIDPSVLPVSFSKAVFWALSRFPMVEPENSTEMALSVRNWLSTCASEISYLFGWKVPFGSDDGGDGNESNNSIKISTMCVPLIRSFKRLTAHFIVKMEQGDLRKQWTWEPGMSESLILLLVDPNDNARHVGRCILEQVSNTRGLACGLQFLCSCTSSLSALLLGLQHALNLVQMDSVLVNFQTLHHFFFVLCKLYKEGFTTTGSVPGSSSDDLSVSKFSSQGGFLWQPVFDSAPADINVHLSNVNTASWQKFSCVLSVIAWPSILKCLAEGKAFVDYKISQMTCVRVLEILPVVFERLHSSPYDMSNRSGIRVENISDFKWLHDLMDWGKSSLAVIVRYWKQTVLGLLDLLIQSCNDNSASAIIGIKKFLSSESVAIDDVAEQVSRLSVSLSSEGSRIVGKANLKLKPLVSLYLASESKCSAQDAQSLSLEDADVQILDSVTFDSKRDRDTVIVLSDDEAQVEVSTIEVIPSHATSSDCILDEKTVITCAAAKRASHGESIEKSGPGIDTSKNLSEDFQKTNFQKLDSDMFQPRVGPTSLIRPKSVDSRIKDKNSKSNVNDSYASQVKSLLKNLSTGTVGSKSEDQRCANKVNEPSNVDIKELVRDAEDDPWELAVKSARHPQVPSIKPVVSGPKRQVIQLNLSVEDRPVNLHRLERGFKRFKPPRLDAWFRPILEIDYFATVGLASGSEEESKTVNKLKEVPVCFQSPDEYVEIFRPLVLEEFKAQLQSSFLEANSSEEMCSGSLSVMSVERIDDFHLVRCVHDGDSAGSRGCSENDLVLLTRQPLQSSSHEVHLIGKVERREKDNKRRLNILVIRLYLQNGSSRLNRARKLLNERSKWYFSRVLNITSQLREFQALSSLMDIPLLPVILNPINQPPGHYECRREYLSKLPKPLQQILKTSYNDSQLQAIDTAIGPLDSKKELELSLIQGPPGTGKTRTILAIVSGLLSASLQQLNDTRRPLNVSKASGTSFANSKPQISQSAAIARAWQDAALARQLNEESDRNCKPMGSCSRGRVLICAQSNAAVDELVSRISSEGLYGSDGVMYKPYLVRVGNAKTVHPNSLPFFIDTLVDHRLAAERIKAGDSKNDTCCDSSTARSNLEKLVDRIRFYEAKRANLRDGNSDSKSLFGEALKGDDGKEMSDVEIAAKLRKLYEEKKAIYTNLSTAQAREKRVNDEIWVLRHKLRKSILREAEIVVTTLSGCGGDLYGVCSESALSHKFGSPSEHTLFDAVVIDEAAQALEPSTLIPLQLLKSKGTKFIMVGDPKQLPATVLSNVASKYMYQCSMFERLQRAGHPVIMLTEQFRMHPEICRFPSSHFYDSKLLNGHQALSKSALFHETECLGPYVFFDVVDGQELRGKNSGALSLYNECEADAAVEIFRFFKKRYPSEFVGGRIGIITPYKCQLSLLRSRFSSAFGSSVTSEMEFNTVDGFQGREVDIIVLSTVRAAEPCSEAPRINSHNIGFVADVRRMNVALTRAKLSLWILGNGRTLQTNHNWAALLRDARERNLVISVKRPYESMFRASFKKHSALENRTGQVKHVENVKQDADNINKRKRRDNHIGAPSNDRIARADKRNVEVDKGKHKSENIACSDQSEQVVNDSEGVPKSEAKKKHRECFVSEGNDGSNASSEVEEATKNVITKRKQQRDAVDALLSSALISSKKSEPSSKPVSVKRPLSPTRTAGHAIKPPKSRKVPPASTSSVRKDQIHGKRKKTH